MSWLSRLVERIVAFGFQLAQALIVGLLTAPFRALKRRPDDDGSGPDARCLEEGEGEE